MSISAGLGAPRFVLRPAERSRNDSSGDVEQDSISDEELVVKTAGGDKESLGSLFRRYVRVVRGIGLRILQDAGEADDLVQEVFLVVYQKCKMFDQSKSKARSWIVQTARHRAIDRRRRLESRNFYTQVEIDEDVLKLPNPGGEAPYDRSLEAVLGREQSQRLFDSLSQDQREVIRLAFYEGHTFEEIARMRGQSFGNVRNHYYRGLEKLRKQVFCAKLPGK